MDRHNYTLTNGRMISIATGIILEFMEHDQYTVIKTSIGEHEVMELFDEVKEIVRAYDIRLWALEN